MRRLRGPLPGWSAPGRDDDVAQGAPVALWLGRVRPMESRKAREQKGESGYSWLYRSAVFHSGTRVTMTILVIVLAAAFFAWYTHTNDDAAPDSLVGLIYAFIGTTLLLLAATMFSLRRRSYRRRQLGGLRASLGWHMS